MGPILGIVAVVLFLAALIGLPIWFMVWSRRVGDEDWSEVYRGLQVFNLPASDRVEVNFRICYGLVVGVRIRYVQVYTSPRDARILMQRIQGLNLRRSLTHLAFPILWIDSYLRCQRELRSIESQAARIRACQSPPVGLHYQ